MKIALFSNKPYWSRFFKPIKHEYEIKYFDLPLNKETALIANGFEAVSAFVNDSLDKDTLTVLKEGGTKVILMRCAGFNNVDLVAADKLGLTILRVPSYSPYSVAEFTITIMLTLNRKIHKAYNKVREGNFDLDGLVGFDMFKKTVGIVGTGKIGEIVATILKGFQCNIIAFDVVENPACKQLGVKYVSLDELWKQSDIITLHAPLNPKTKHMVNDESIAKMKDQVMLINTSRGGLVDSSAVIKGLKSGKIGYLGLDVYEEESDLYFEDRSSYIIQDDVLTRLMTFPNVLITGHQSWFTKQALEAICKTTIDNLKDFENGTPNSVNLVRKPEN
eukprot:gene7468-9175_t